MQLACYERANQKGTMAFVDFDVPKREQFPEVSPLLFLVFNITRPS